MDTRRGDMASATLRALLLTGLLGAAAPSLADGAAHAAGEPEIGLSTADGGVPLGQTEWRGDGRGERGSAQALSTLGALTLGILGLLWVRRHTTRL